MENQFIFDIDAFTPDTIPMQRLAEYMLALSALIGQRESTHFVGVVAGSARLVSRLDPPAVPKAEARLNSVRSDGPQAPKDAVKAYNEIEAMLANDNAVGKLIAPSGAVIIPFIGRNRPKPLAFPTFRQEGSIDGHIVRIGGQDSSAHAILQDGDVTYSGIKMPRKLARVLCAYLYGPKLRLHGSGRWQRTQEGAWLLRDFDVASHEILDDTPLTDLVASIRNDVIGSLGDVEAFERLADIRGGGEPN